MKDKNAIPLKCMGCFAVSRVYEAALGRGPGGGPAMPYSCCSVVLRKGINPVPRRLPMAGCRGGFASGRLVGGFSVRGLEQSHSFCG